MIFNPSMWINSHCVGSTWSIFQMSFYLTTQVKNWVLDIRHQYSDIKGRPAPDIHNLQFYASAVHRSPLYFENDQMKLDKIEKWPLTFPAPSVQWEPLLHYQTVHVSSPYLQWGVISSVAALSHLITSSVRRSSVALTALEEDPCVLLIWFRHTQPLILGRGGKYIYSSTIVSFRCTGSLLKTSFVSEFILLFLFLCKRILLYAVCQWLLCVMRLGFTCNTYKHYKNRLDYSVVH